MISKPKFKSSANRRRIKKNGYKRAPRLRPRISISRYRPVFLTVAGICLISATSALFILAYDLLIQWDYFNAKQIHVSGNRCLEPDHVMQWAGVKTGVNIMAVNTARTEKRLISHPWIAGAEVYREFPSWIHIRVREHEPLAVIDLGRRFLLNSKGHIFKKWSAADPGNLPVVGGLGYGDIPVDGAPGSPRFDAVMQVLKLGRESASVLPIHMIKQIDVDREMGLTVYALGNVTGRVQVIKIGYNDYQDKYERLKAIFSKVKRAEIEVIDVNDRNRIIVDPAKAESPAANKKEV